MSKFLYKKEVIIPLDGKMYKFVESLEEISCATQEEIETIDLTEDEPTGSCTTDQPAMKNHQILPVSPQYQPDSPPPIQQLSPQDQSSSPSPIPQLSPQYSPPYPGYASLDEPPYSPYTQTEEYRGAQNVHE